MEAALSRRVWGKATAFPRQTLFSRTLSVRLIATSLAWVVTALVTTGILLILLFRYHIERRFDFMLSGNMEELVSASEVEVGTSMRLSWRPADPRFNRPYSGWYWQIVLDGTVIAKSNSILNTSLVIDEPAEVGKAQVQQIIGPENLLLRALIQKIKFPDVVGAYTFVITGPASDITRDVWAFAGTVAATLVVLGIILFGVVFAQVSFGLKPLRAIRQSLTDIRTGKSVRLPETFPEEVQPVISELNALLDYNSTLLSRARTQVGNLAHTLKNPLTVLRNDAEEVNGKLGISMREQLESVNDSIDRYLSRARVSGVRVLGVQAAVNEIAEGLKFSMELLHKNRGLDIQVADLEGLSFHGDPQDFEEMLGNLMDNACKWSQEIVSVRGYNEGEWLFIYVEDDGPGIPDNLRLLVLQRGQRLDENLPGRGLGLGITSDIAEIYRGSIKLDKSRLGGLAVRLKLPAYESGNFRS